MITLKCCHIVDRDGRKGGETMVIINQKVKITKSKKMKFSWTGALHVELEKNGKLFSVLSLYRALQGNIDEFIDYINKWSNENKERYDCSRWHKHWHT